MSNQSPDLVPAQPATKARFRPIRVAFIAHYATLYGANRSLLNLIDGLAAHSVVAHVVVPEEGALTRALADRGVPIRILPLRWWMGKRACSGFEKTHLGTWLLKCLRWRGGTLKRLCQNIRILPALVAELRLWDVDLVYTNSSVIPIGFAAARILRRPHIWHLREFADLHYYLHYDWGVRVFRHFLARADARIAVSDAVCAHHLGSKWPERTYVIYNGVATAMEFDRLYSRMNSRLPGHPDGPYTFAMLGLLHPSKGQGEAIRALSLLPDEVGEARLVIAGDGDIHGLKTLAEELGIADKVEFLGYIDNPYEAYMVSDAVLVCSRFEAMGRVAVEAMSACLPVIGYDHAGTAEIVRHGETGLLYRDGAESLAACMKQFMANPAWARQLGRNGWQVSRKEYTVEAFAESVHQVMVDTLDSTGYGNHPEGSSRALSTSG